MKRKRNEGDDFVLGETCSRCGKSMWTGDGLDPTPECNPCAQNILAEMRAQDRVLSCEETREALKRGLRAIGAEEIRKLRSEVRRLRKALRLIANTDEEDCAPWDMNNLAKDALKRRAQ